MTRSLAEMVRVVATDLDGTLVHSDNTISARTTAALTRAAGAGVTVVLVTGRPPRWLTGVADATGHHGTAICSNGAVVYDLQAEAVLSTTVIPRDVVATVVHTLLSALPELTFALETGGEVLRGTGYHSGWTIDHDLNVPRLSLAELVDNDATKLLASHPRMGVDELLAATGELVGEFVTPTHSNGRGLVEMGPLGVSKATTLEAFCASIGADASEVIAFGDMPNDLPMLAWAGSSYAMANAHPQVLAAVDRITLSNDQDGVAAVLEELFG